MEDGARDVCGRGTAAAAAGAGAGSAAAARAPGRRVSLAPREPTCVPLTRITVGMWSSRRHRACQLLLLPEQLVVLVDRRAAAPKSPSRFSLAGLTARSPFASGHSRYRHAGCVHAFELPLSSIRGLDYSNPLCLEGRLVLEVNHLRKREFPNIESAREYFLQPAIAGAGKPLPAAEVGTVGVAAGVNPGLSQHAETGLVQQSLSALAGIPGLPASAAAAPAAGCSSPCGCEAQQDGSFSARGDLMLKLGANNAATVCQQAGPALPSSAPMPICTAGSGRLSSTSPSLGAPGAGEGPHAGLAGSSGVASQDDDGTGSPLSTCSSFCSDMSMDGVWYFNSPASSAASSLLCTPSIPAAAAVAAMDVARGSSAGPATAGLGLAHGLAHGAGTGSGRSPLVLRGSTSNRSGFGLCSWEVLPQGATTRSTPTPIGGGVSGEQMQQATLLHVGSAPSATLAAFLSTPPKKLCKSPLSGGSSLPAAGTGMHRVASDSQLTVAGSGPVQQEGQQVLLVARRDSEWPAVHAFTSISKVYPYRTVVLNWNDPRLPGLLRPIIQENERLLKLYESGLPAWAVYFPQWGLFYRPWLRTLTWLLFYAFSVFSFVMGFYDLYKNLPGLQALMQRLMSSVWLPPAAVLEWLEQHTQIRLSILLTYLFSSRSEAFLWLVRWAHNFARVTRTAWQPVLAAVGPPAAALRTALQLAGAQTWQALSAVGLTLAAIFSASLAPLAAVLLQCWAAVGGALLPLLQGLQLATAGRLLWVGEGLRQLRDTSGATWAVVREAGAGVAASVAAVAGAAQAGQAVGGATTKAVAGQAVWLYVLPADAMEVLRTSAVKVAKSAQAVAKFFLQICNNVVRHRLTLELQAGRAWRRFKQRLFAIAMAPLLLLAELAKWLLVVVRLLIVDRIEAGHRAALDQERREAAQREGLQQQQQQQRQQEGGQAEGCEGTGAVQQQQQQGRGDWIAAAEAAVAASPAASVDGISGVGVHLLVAGSGAPPPAAPSRLKDD